MYDIEFVIPVTSKDKYGQRLLDLKKTGLLNIGEKKVLLSLLAGPEKLDQIVNDWDKNIDVSVIPGTHKQETAKTYEYFSTMPIENANRSRWIAKFDDDSITDVSGLVNKLDEEYDHTREYYIVTEFRPEQHRYEDDILRKMGFNRWFNPKNVIWHELEGSIVSQASMYRILNNKTAKEFMKARSQTPEGYNDYGLACAARICKIYPSDAYFISKNPSIGDFSLFGGYLCHIHNLSHDNNEHAFDLFQRMIKKDVGANSPIYPEVVNREFVYNNGQGMHIIKLKDTGIIEGPGDSRIWHIKPGGSLEFLKSDGSLVCVFDNYENTNNLTGYTAGGRQSFKPTLRKLA